jgi:hypothetical protein
VYFLLSFPVYAELQPRQSLVSGLAPVSLCHPLPFNFLRIRTSKAPLPQPLHNPHLRSPLGCVGNKGFTGTRIHRQLFRNQHLRVPLRSAGNTGVIILLESALTKNAPATPLESALPKNRGEGAEMSNSDQARSSSTFKGANGSTVRSRAQCALPFRPVILDGHPMKQAHHDYDAASPSSPLPARGSVGRRVSRVTDHVSRARPGWSRGVTNHV